MCHDKQSTHTDRDHIHNHIIFYDISFVDYRHSHINKKWYYETRKVSDRLCDEYGLSVISPNANKGKSYIEHQAAKQGVSYKAQLKADIDRAIRKSLDYADFLLRMEIAGYEVKQGKYISFKAKDRDRFIRGKTLGGYYAEDSINERIAKNNIHRPQKDSRRINFIIDIQNCIKAQESKGCFWEEEEQQSASKIRQMTDLKETKFATTRAIIYNLKQASRTLNFLTENNLTTYEENDLKVKTLKIQWRIFADKSKKLTKAEYEILLTAAKSKNNEQLYYLMQTIASTGICISELSAINAEAVKMGQATINCKGKLRQIFLPIALCKMLNEYIKNGIYKAASYL